MKEHYDWMREHINTIIDKGWHESESCFIPDGGDGPGPISILLYKFGYAENERRYLEIADKLVVHSLDLLEQLLQQWGWSEAIAKIETRVAKGIRGQKLPEDLINIKDLSLRNISTGHSASPTVNVRDAITSLPVLISGMVWYSDDPQIKTRAEKTIKAIALLLSFLILTKPKFVEDLLKQMEIDYGLMVAASQVAKYDTYIGTFGDEKKNKFFSWLGAQVADFIQEREWHENDLTYTADYRNWDLSQLLEALGLAYPMLKKPIVKNRVLATFFTLEKKGHWTEFYYHHIDDLDPKEKIFGVYFGWANDYMKMWFSPIYLFQSGLVEWYKNLRVSSDPCDKAWAGLMYNRFSYVLNFCRWMMTTKDDPIIAHDMKIDKNFQIIDRNTWGCDVGCMQCNASFVLSYMNMLEANK